MTRRGRGEGGGGGWGVGYRDHCICSSREAVSAHLGGEKGGWEVGARGGGGVAEGASLERTMHLC